MASYREILRLNSMGVSQRHIASSLQCSRNTISELLIRAARQGLTWPLQDELLDEDLTIKLFPEKAPTPTSNIPDCEHIHKELARKGVTLSLLWAEYCNECQLRNEIPLKYTQYCNYYRKYAAKTKATMHIQRKPGEQLEVDWAGTTAHIVDRNTGEELHVYVFIAALSSSQYSYTI